jgi:hypothetical protein
MNAILGREVKIARQQLQIPHHQIAFQNETFFMALLMEVRIINGAGLRTHENGSPLGNGILKQNLKDITPRLRVRRIALHGFARREGSGVTKAQFELGPKILQL